MRCSRISPRSRCGCAPAARIVARITLAVLLVLPAASASAQGRPNVLWITADDAGWADFTFQRRLLGEHVPQRLDDAVVEQFGPGSVTAWSTEIPTPSLDRLAARGVVFGQAYTAPGCSPSRTQMVLGQYQQRSGHWRVSPNFPDTDRPYDGLDPVRDDTVFERFQRLGYRTIAIGKWHLGTVPDHEVDGTLRFGNLPPRVGVDRFIGSLQRGTHFGQTSTSFDDPRDYRRRMTLLPDGTYDDVVVEDETTGVYSSEWYTDVAVDEIRHAVADGRPFFMMLNHRTPHAPMQAMEQDLADPRLAGLTGDRLIYAAMIVAMDRGIGRVLDALEDPDGDPATDDSIVDDTHVVFISDNGGMDARAAAPDDPRADNRPLNEYKSSLWEGGIRVPMLMAGAGIDPGQAGTVFTQPVASFDMLPTAVALAGGQAAGIDGQQVDGTNLLPFINAQAPGVADLRPRDEHYGVYWHPSFLWQQGLAREGDTKLLIIDGERMLFDLSTDLAERNNIAADHPDLVARLERKLITFELSNPRNATSNVFAWTSNGMTWLSDDYDNAQWSTRFVWRPDVSDVFPREVVQFRVTDAHRDLVLRFPLGDGSGFVSENDLVRESSLEFMAHRLELLGDDAGASASNGTGVITGLPLMLVSSSSPGDRPIIALDARDDRRANGDFGYSIDLPITAWDHLTVEGDGNARFEVGGGIIERRPNRDFRKLGLSTLTLRSTLAFTGEVYLQGGELAVVGDGRIEAPIIEVRNTATLRLASPRPALSRDVELRIDRGTLAFDADHTQIVGRLVVDGQELPQGVYTESGSSFIVGPGRLQACTGSADLDGSGRGDLVDILLFFQAYAANDTELADSDQSGSLDLFDILLFLERLSGGC